MSLRRSIACAGLCALATIAAVNSAARGVQLANAQADFSTAAQGSNGFQYGVYTGANAIVEGGAVVFSTANFVPTTTGNGPTWLGNESFSTPALWTVGQHPGFDTLDPAVRRYTVGSNGEPAYTGSVEIAGQFFDLASGATGAFITVDGVNLLNQPVPNTGD